MNKKSKPKKNNPQIAQNKRARHDYLIQETFEAGIQLEGWEVKSLREGRSQLKEGYVNIKKAEAWLVGVNISPLNTVASHIKTDPIRSRKLLLNRREINKLIGKVNREGLTLVPTKMYFKKGKAKIEIAVAKGKKHFDKRQTKKTRDWNRDRARYVRKTS